VKWLRLRRGGDGVKSTLAISTARQPPQDNRCRPTVLSLPLLYGSAMKFRYVVAGIALAFALAALIMARDLGLFL
jgi:hypothetical protein